MLSKYYRKKAIVLYYSSKKAKQLHSIYFVQNKARWLDT